MLMLRHQLQTLSESLSTLTHEKSRLETGFVADHKKLRVKMLGDFIILNVLKIN